MMTAARSTTNEAPVSQDALNGYCYRVNGEVFTWLALRDRLPEHEMNGASSRLPFPRLRSHTREPCSRLCERSSTCAHCATPAYYPISLSIPAYQRKCASVHRNITPTRSTRLHRMHNSDPSVLSAPADGSLPTPHALTTTQPAYAMTSPSEIVSHRPLACSIARKSDDNDMGIEAQHARNAQKAEADGFFIPDTDEFRFSDNDTSGARTTRLDLERFVDFVKLGALFGRAYCTDRDRMMRWLDARRIFALEIWCEDRGVQIVYCDEPTPATSESDDGVDRVGRFLGQAFRSAMASQERVKIRRRTRSGARHLIKRGFWVGGVPGYGIERWLADIRTGEYIEMVRPGASIHRAGCAFRLRWGDDGRKEVIRQIYDWIEAGLSIRGIAMRLNDGRVPGPLTYRHVTRRVTSNAASDPVRPTPSSRSLGADQVDKSNTVASEAVASAPELTFGPRAGAASASTDGNRVHLPDRDLGPPTAETRVERWSYEAVRRITRQPLYCGVLLWPCRWYDNLRLRHLARAPQDAATLPSPHLLPDCPSQNAPHSGGNHVEWRPHGSVAAVAQMPSLRGELPDPGAAPLIRSSPVRRGITTPPVEHTLATADGEEAIWYADFLPDAPVTYAQWLRVQEILDGYGPCSSPDGLARHRGSSPNGPALDYARRSTWRSSLEPTGVGRKRRSPKYLLSGLVRCATCGAGVHGNTHKTLGRSATSYVHRRPDVFGHPVPPCASVKHRVFASVIEPHALALTRAVLEREDFAKLVDTELKEHSGLAQSERITKDLIAARKQEVNYRAAAERASDNAAQAATEVGRKMHNAAVDRYAMLITSVREIIAHLEGRARDVRRTEGRLASAGTNRGLAELLDTLPAGARQRIVGAIILRVDIEFFSRRATFHVVADPVLPAV